MMNKSVLLKKRAKHIRLQMETKLKTENSILSKKMFYFIGNTRIRGGGVRRTKNDIITYLSEVDANILTKH